MSGEKNQDRFVLVFHPANTVDEEKNCCSMCDFAHNCLGEYLPCVESERFDKKTGWWEFEETEEAP